jgi:hypothetical protein
LHKINSLGIMASQTQEVPDTPAPVRCDSLAQPNPHSCQQLQCRVTFHGLRTWTPDASTCLLRPARQPAHRHILCKAQEKRWSGIRSQIIPSGRFWCWNWLAFEIGSPSTSSKINCPASAVALAPRAEQTRVPDATPLACPRRFHTLSEPHRLYHATNELNSPVRARMLRLSRCRMLPSRRLKPKWSSTTLTARRTASSTGRSCNTRTVQRITG